MDDQLRPEGIDLMLIPESGLLPDRTLTNGARAILDARRDRLASAAASYNSYLGIEAPGSFDVNASQDGEVDPGAAGKDT